MVIPGSSGSLQMVDHSLIDVPVAHVYYKGHCRAMCASSPVYPVIIGTTDRARTSGGNKDKDNDGDQGGDIPAWMSEKKSNVED